MGSLPCELGKKLSYPDYDFCVAYKVTQDFFGMEGLSKAIILANDEGEGIIGDGTMLSW